MIYFLTRTRTFSLDSVTRAVTNNGSYSHFNITSRYLLSEGARRNIREAASGRLQRGGDEVPSVMVFMQDAG